MEYRVMKGEIPVCETILDTSAEQPIDLDFSLPDYCPDIQKILKCQIYPTITEQTVSDRLDVEGEVLVKLLYLDSGKKAVRCCEYASPFSTPIALKKAPENPSSVVTYLNTKVDYVNCRAVSPRKLDIHGAFSIQARAVSTVMQSIVSSIEEEDIQQKVSKVTLSRVSSMAQQSFTVNEVLELGQGKPEAEAIVRTDASALVEDVKVVADKLIVKGEALIKVLYMGSIENGTLETMEFSIPVSQIVDAPGTDEGCLCDARLSVMGCSLQIRTDSDGADTLLSCEMKLMATAVSYREEEAQIVTDAYSTKYELNLEYQTANLEQLLEVISDNVPCKSTVEIKEGGASGVIDVWSDFASCTAVKGENGQLNLKGKFNLCVLAVNSEGEPVYLEKMADFEFTKERASLPENLRCETGCFVSSVTYRINGSGGLEIRAEVRVRTLIYQSVACKAVCGVSADESRPRQKDEAASLILYYAEKNENVWDIARNYCTGAQAILAENDLDEEILSERRMLFIPLS